VGPWALLVFVCACGLLAWQLRRRDRMVRQALLAA
jgi:cytochrome oxidase assembly protein ShyY1